MNESNNHSADLNRSRKIAALYEVALDYSAGHERDLWLQQQCGSDISLLKEINALFEADKRAGGFLAETGTVVVSPSCFNDISPSSHSEVLPGTELGPYRILESLGEGGFGEVFSAEQEEPVRRQVAVKIIKPGMDSREVLSRFEAELQALAMMDHPGIAKALDAGTTQSGRPFFVMEWVRGVEITKFCDCNQLSIEDRLTLFEQVCSAIQHAHQKGVIHRDIKPSNVLVTTYDGAPTPKVIDFGIAKAMQQKLTKQIFHTRHEQFIGTPAYMSPEQAEQSGIDLDTRVDVYALGVLLYELLAGKPPFDPSAWAKAGYQEIRHLIREVIPKKPSTRLAELPDSDRSDVAQFRSSNPERLCRTVRGDLDWIVMKALEKDRQRRYESPSALARDIARFRAHETIEARPPSATYQFTRFIRRHRLVCSTGLFSFLSLLVGMIFLIYGLSEAERKRIEAEDNLTIAKQNEAEAKAQTIRADLEAATVRRLLYPNILDAAMEALRNGQKTRAAELLATCSEAERGWEWRRASRALIEPSHSFDSLIPGSGIHDLRLSQRANRMLSRSGDGTLQVWDLQSNHLLWSSDESSSPWLQADFELQGDTVVAIGVNGELYRVNPITGSRKNILEGDTTFKQIAMAGQGEYILTGEDDGKITLWSERLEESIAVMEDRVFDLNCLAVDSQAGLSAAGTRSGSTVVWDATGIRLWELNSNGSSLRALQFSPDGSLLATGDEFGHIRIFSAEDGRQLADWSGHRRAVSAIGFSPDGQTLASGGAEGGVSIRDIVSGRELTFFVGDEAGVGAILFTLDEDTLLVGGGSGRTLTYPLNQFTAPQVYLGHEDLVFETALTPDSKTLVSASRDGSLRYWDRSTGVEIRRLTGHANAFLSIDVSADGQWVATLDDDATLQLRRIDTGKLIWEKEIDYRVRHVCFHPTQPLLATGAERIAPDPLNRDPLIAIWNVEEAKEIIHLSGKFGNVLQMSFNPDGKKLVSASSHSVGSKDGRTLIWGLQSGKIETSLSSGTDAVSHSVIWSRAGDRIYTGHSDGTIRFWKVNGENERTIYAFGEPIGALALSPDGKTLASGAWYSEEMKLWNANTGELRETLSTDIPGLAHITHDAAEDGWIISGLDGGLARFSAAEPKDDSFRHQREVTLNSRRAQLNEALLLSGFGDTSSFVASIENLIQDYRSLWEQSGREADSTMGPEKLAATSLAIIAEEYLQSNLFEESFIAMTRCLELDPSENREERLRWIEEAEALDEGLERAMTIDQLEDYVGAYGACDFTLRQGQLIYRDTELEEEWSLQPIQKDHFQLEGDNTRRIRFLRSNPDGFPEEVLIKEFSGRQKRYYSQI